jgi:ATP-binding cassette, subfamily B, bacterial
MSGLSGFMRPTLDRMKRIWAFTAGHHQRMIYLSALVAMGTGLLLLQPLLFGFIVDNAAEGSHLASSIVAAAGFMAAGVLAVLLRWRAATIAGRLGYTILAETHKSLFDKLIALPFLFFSTVRSGAIVSRLTNDVNATEPLVAEIFVKTVANWFTLAIVATVLLVTDWRLAMLLLLIPLTLIPIRHAEKRINHAIGKSFSLNAELTTSIESTLGQDHIVLARQAQRSARESASFAGTADAVAKISAEMHRWRVTINASYDGVFSAVSGIGVLVGLYWISRGELSIGNLVVFALFVRQIQAPVMELIGIRYPAARAMIALDRLDKVLESDLGDVREERRSEPRGSTPSVRSAESSALENPVLEFRSVDFEYPAIETVSIPGLSSVDNVISMAGVGLTGLSTAPRGPSSERAGSRPWALRQISFSVSANEKVAIVGSSGSGKSTIAALCAGLVEPTRGEIYLSGQTTSGFAGETFSNYVALVRQETHLLHDSIAANLRYVAPEARDEDLLSACRQAGLGPLVAELPEGLETVVGEKGYLLSGGERQRLSLARAFLTNRPLLVLDEVTSNLDGRTEAGVLEAVEEIGKDRAVVMIAHRLSSVRFATRIIVLDHGEIVETGTHDVLLDRGGVYAELFASQRREAT